MPSIVRHAIQAVEHHIVLGALELLLEAAIVRALRILGQTEVGELELALVVNKSIFKLEVEMDHPAPVHVLKRVKQLFGAVAGQVLAERLSHDHVEALPHVTILLHDVAHVEMVVVGIGGTALLLIVEHLDQ